MKNLISFDGGFARCTCRPSNGQVLYIHSARISNSSVLQLSDCFRWVLVREDCERGLAISLQLLVCFWVLHDDDDVGRDDGCRAADCSYAGSM